MGRSIERKRQLHFFKNVSLDAYRNSLEIVDFPAELKGVYSLPIDTVVELENGARALIDKKGHLASWSKNNTLLCKVIRKALE